MTSHLVPYGLTAEQRSEPLGLDVRRPRLSWKLRSPVRGATQAAYRLTAALRPDDLDRPDRLIWDTGRVESGETLLIAWSGPEPAPSTRYFWRVSVFADGSVAVADSWFETGLLRPDAWEAAWIGRDPVNLPPMDPPVDHDRTVATHGLPPPLYLRRSFRLDREPLRARLYATAQGVYQTRLNGFRVGDAELSPGWTDYRYRIQYQTYDVTSGLRVGENVLAAVVADGWWSGYVGFDPRRPAQHYGDGPGLLARLVVWFADGSSQVVVTDAEWLEGPGEIQFSDLLMGESVDARRRVHGWDSVDFEDAREGFGGTAGLSGASGSRGPHGFRPVAVLPGGPGPVVAEPDEPVRVTETVPARSVTRIGAGAGVYVADFGQNLVGRVRLTVHGAPAGTRIVVRHAEILDGGELYVDNLRRAEATDVFVAAGLGTEVFEPLFTFHGFRYAEVSGLRGGFEVEARVIHSDTPWTGSFECSDDGVNQLYSNIRWGQRGNWVSVPTDCPQRDERLGWLADAQIFAPTASRNADVSAFFARWMLDVLDTQDDEGAFTDVAPVVSLHRQAAPAWGDGAVIIPWHLWRTYGDRAGLERSFDGMRRWVDFVRRHNPDLVWRRRTGNSYGDWLQIDADTPRDVLATAYFARSTEILADTARVLGRPAEEYRSLLGDIRKAFQENFVHPDGRVHGDTQTGYLLALAFGLVPEHLREDALGHLCADLRSRGYRLTTGFAGVGLLCPVLTDNGRADVAYALLHQDEYPSWGYSIRHGATTIWERWDGWTESAGFQSAAMNSFNHYSLGSVGDWLFGRVAGIDQTPGSVAYSEPLLCPTPGGRLTWARARQATARGDLACGWSLETGELVITATVPPGVRALLRLPAGAGPVADHPGVSRHPAGLRLEPGTYRLTASFSPEGLVAEPAGPSPHGRP